jgi:NB-ARC domain
VAAAASTAGGGGVGPRFVVPFLRNSGFVGRAEDLGRVHALLQKGEAVGVRPVAAAGMGGIGKTQLAVEYAYRHRDDYPGGVYWVNAAQDVQAEMAELATQVGLFEDGAPDAERQQRRLLAFVRFLGERSDALVIFDNVEDPRSLRNKTFGFVPAQLACRVLFTTRRRDGSGSFASVLVGALTEDEALELLEGSARRSAAAWEGGELAAAREMCRMLGGLPLALALAGSFLWKNPDVPAVAYRDRLLEEGALAGADATDLESDDLPTRHEASVEATLRVDWEALAKLPGGGQAERWVLQAAALLGEAPPPLPSPPAPPPGARPRPHARPSPSSPPIPQYPPRCPSATTSPTKTSPPSTPPPSSSAWPPPGPPCWPPSATPTPTPSPPTPAPRSSSRSTSKP